MPLLQETHATCSSPNSRIEDRTTFLHQAVEKGHTGVVKFLIEKDKGATVNAEDENGVTPLYIAAFCGHPAIVELLIRNGANVNAKNKKGGTPLYIATFCGYPAIAELLIRNGADVNAKNKNGVTPLGMAITVGDKDIAELLVRNDANVDAELLLHIAVISNRLEMVKFLVEQCADVKHNKPAMTHALALAKKGLIFQRRRHEEFKNTSSGVNPYDAAAAQQIITFLFRAAENSHDDNNNNNAARTFSRCNLF